MIPCVFPIPISMFKRMVVLLIRKIYQLNFAEKYPENDIIYTIYTIYSPCIVANHIVDIWHAHNGRLVHTFIEFLA